MGETVAGWLWEYRKPLVLLVFLAVAGAGVGVYAMFGPPHLIALTETPEFCAACHLHDGHYKTWAHTGAHRNARCVDCHLPNDNLVEHFVWKSIDGVKDVTLFASGFVSERPKLTAHARAVTQANCIRCHAETVAKIDTASRYCWECHRAMTHQYSGTF